MLKHLFSLTIAESPEIPRDCFYFHTSMGGSMWWCMAYPGTSWGYFCWGVGWWDISCCRRLLVCMFVPYYILQSTHMYTLYIFYLIYILYTSVCALQNKQIYIYFLIFYLIHIFFMYILMLISISSISGDTNIIWHHFAWFSVGCSPLGGCHVVPSRSAVEQCAEPTRRCLRRWKHLTVSWAAR